MCVGPDNLHYNDVIMSVMACQITSLTIVYSSVYSGADQRKHQSFAPLAFVRGIHRRPVNSPHKWPVTRKSFPFDDVIIFDRCCLWEKYDSVTLSLKNCKSRTQWLKFHYTDIDIQPFNLPTLPRVTSLALEQSYEVNLTDMAKDN